MILRRLGNKSKLAESIYKTFPKHHVYIEPFFGAGGLYFNKPKAMHNIVNDIDDDVFNLWNVYNKQYDKLLEAIQNMPKSESLFNYWKKNPESDPVLKALRFLMLSNFSYMGGNSLFKVSPTNPQKILLDNYLLAKDIFSGVTICNSDYRDLLHKMEWAHFYKKNKFIVFCYADPPYLDTTDNYSHSFTEQDSIDLFNILESKSKEYPDKFYYAISEFNHPFILEQAKQRNLNVVEIGERRNLGNRKMEILVCNYEVELGLFDSLGGASNSKSSLAFV